MSWVLPLPLYDFLCATQRLVVQRRVLLLDGPGLCGSRKLGAGEEVATGGVWPCELCHCAPVTVSGWSRGAGGLKASPFLLWLVLGCPSLEKGFKMGACHKLSVTLLQECPVKDVLLGSPCATRLLPSAPAAPQEGQSGRGAVTFSAQGQPRRGVPHVSVWDGKNVAKGRERNGAENIKHWNGHGRF